MWFFIYLIALALGKRKLFTGKNAEFVFFDSQQPCHAPAKHHTYQLKLCLFRDCLNLIYCKLVLHTESE